ncbi:hypothetical protein BJ742DRAFT_477158 [Cladochytrium replicatum]|nr:hypothetical protein BJ742DRAFT_477158 [Cladochytrium replicatum]
MAEDIPKLFTFLAGTLAHQSQASAEKSGGAEQCIAQISQMSLGKLAHAFLAARDSKPFEEGALHRNSILESTNLKDIKLEWIATSNAQKQEGLHVSAKLPLDKTNPDVSRLLNAVQVSSSAISIEGHFPAHALDSGKTYANPESGGGFIRAKVGELALSKVLTLADAVLVLYADDGLAQPELANHALVKDEDSLVDSFRLEDSTSLGNGLLLRGRVKFQKLAEVPAQIRIWSGPSLQINDGSGGYTDVEDIVDDQESNDNDNDADGESWDDGLLDFDPTALLTQKFKWPGSSADTAKNQVHWQFRCALQSTQTPFSALFPTAELSSLSDVGMTGLRLQASTVDALIKGERIKKGLAVKGAFGESGFPLFGKVFKDSDVGKGWNFSVEWKETKGRIIVDIPEAYQIDFGNGYRTTAMQARVSVLPVPSITFNTTFLFPTPNDPKPLNFQTIFTATPVKMTGFGTLKGYWTSPFGIPHLNLGPSVALKLDIDYAVLASTGLPSSVSLATSLGMGEKKIAMAMQANFAEPLKQMISGEGDGLGLNEVVDLAASMADPPTGGERALVCFYPDGILHLEKCKIHIAPERATIGTLVYDKGVSIESTIKLLGRRGLMKFKVQAAAILADGLIEGFALGPLVVRGSASAEEEGGKDAKVRVSLSKAEQEILVDGFVDLGGVATAVLACIDTIESGPMRITFSYEKHFTNELSYTVQAQSIGTLGENDIAHLNGVEQNKDNIWKPFGKRQVEVDPLKDMDYKLHFVLDPPVIKDLTEDLQSALRDAVRHVSAKMDECEAMLEGARTAHASRIVDARANVEILHARLKKLREDVERTKAAFELSVAAAKDGLKVADQAAGEALTGAESAVAGRKDTWEGDVSSFASAMETTGKRYHGAVSEAQKRVESEKPIAASQADSSLPLGSLSSLAHKGKKVALFGAALGGDAVGTAVGAGVNFAQSSAGQQLAQNVIGGTATAIHVANTAGRPLAVIASGAVLEGAHNTAEYVAWRTAQTALDHFEQGGELERMGELEKVVADVEGLAGDAAFKLATEALEQARTNVKGLVKTVLDGTEAQVVVTGIECVGLLSTVDSGGFEATVKTTVVHADRSHDANDNREIKLKLDPAHPDVFVEQMIAAILLGKDDSKKEAETTRSISFPEKTEKNLFEIVAAIFDPSKR